MRTRPSRLWAVRLVGAALLLSSGVCGCSPDGESATDETDRFNHEAEERVPEEQTVVARVGGEPVTLDEVDAALRLKFHDLERAKYAIRERRLIELIQKRLGGANVGGSLRQAIETGEVEILLEPPDPPRLSLGIAGAPLRGEAGSPVTVLVFCDFESPHCARVQPALRRLLKIYSGELGLAWRDLPLPFHRNARVAAEAARCAEEQGAFWAYHDALYLQQDDLARASLQRTAETLALDPAQFRECLDQGRRGEAIDADLRAADQLGLGSVPVFFVNGLYLKGPQPEIAFRKLIDGELGRLGLENPRGEGGLSRKPSFPATARRSDLPLKLTGTVVSQDPTRSLAIIRIEGEATARLFATGDSVLGEVTLDSVDPARAYLRRGDLLEYLPLASADETRPGSPDKEAARPPAPEAAGVLRLRREAVDRALEHRAELEEDLETGRLDLQGKRLLKLTRVEPRSLYEMLGLKARDVILQVNGEWVHDQSNPLWETLRRGSRVTVVVMRRGFPKTFLYEID
jgi:protein-disulfide isomerase/type II secretory pathway component PulC